MAYITYSYDACITLCNSSMCLDISCNFKLLRHCFTEENRRIGKIYKIILIKLSNKTKSVIINRKKDYKHLTLLSIN